MDDPGPLPWQYLGKRNKQNKWIENGNKNFPILELVTYYKKKSLKNYLFLLYFFTNVSFCVNRIELKM